MPTATDATETNSSRPLATLAARIGGHCSNNSRRCINNSSRRCNLLAPGGVGGDDGLRLRRVPLEAKHLDLGPRLRQLLHLLLQVLSVGAPLKRLWWWWLS